MSLKDWKLLALNSRTSGEDAPKPSFSSHQQAGRKPPKTNLREQIANLERLALEGDAAGRRVEQELVPCAPAERNPGGAAAQEEEDADSVPSAALDSEAGLFVQTEPIGPFEPLVLSPPVGDDSSEEPVVVPASINSRLLEHQRAGVKFLYTLYRENRGGILGDDMGLGKTIQSIAFLAAILAKDEGFGRWKHKTLPSDGASSAKNRFCKKAVLILCPTSVIQNWENEFEAWGSFEVGIYHGALRDSVLCKVEAKTLEVVLTSHDTFRLYGAELCKVPWDCVIVDEAHRLKNEKSKLYEACLQISSKRRYGLTGTIMQNKLLEMFNIFDWVAPGCLGAREHFRDYYDKPLKEGQRISAPDMFVRIAGERKSHLGKVLERYLLRRTKDETIGHLMMGKEDNVIFCKMSPLQRRIYKRMLNSPDFMCLVSKDLPCTCGSPRTRAQCCHRTVPCGPIWSYLHRDTMAECDKCPYCLVLPCLTKLQQASNHVELMKPNPKDDPEKQKKDEDFAALVLGEDAALAGGLTQEESFLGLSDAQHCGKMAALEKLFASWISAGDKVLLFSYSVKMLDILEKFVIRKGYCFSRLDGSSPMNTRQSMVDDFNSSPSKQVFLISTRAGGLGLNLVSANRVVIFDPSWNPAIDLQAQDRSFRYGQRRHVTVFRLLAAGSLEELVYTRQIYKQQLFNIAVTGVDEKRYFEGVQDTKNTGELFGIGNLLKDLSDEVFTSNIIEDDKILSIQPDVAVKEITSKKLHLRGLKRQVQVNDSQDEHGLVALAQLIQEGAKVAEGQQLAKSEKSCAEERRPLKERLPEVLINTGVVYAHRNEEVVNYRAGGPKRELKRAAGADVAGTSKAAPVQHAVRPASAQIGVRSCRSSRPSKVRKSNRGDIEAVATTGDVSKASHDAGVDQGKSRHQFAQLARYRGLSDKEFSRWVVEISAEERDKILRDFQCSTGVRSCRSSRPSEVHRPTRENTELVATGDVLKASDDPV